MNKKIKFKEFINNDFVCFDDTVENKILKWFDENDSSDHNILIVDYNDYDYIGTFLNKELFEFIIENKEIFSKCSPEYMFVDFDIENTDEEYNIPSDDDIQLGYSILNNLTVIPQNDFKILLKSYFNDFIENKEYYSDIKNSFFDWIEFNKKGLN